MKDDIIEKMSTAIDTSILTKGDIVHYFNYDNGEFIIDIGIVKSDNLYSDGVQVVGNGWTQYVGKWFICKVERNGKIIFQQD